MQTSLNKHANLTEFLSRMQEVLSEDHAAVPVSAAVDSNNEVERFRCKVPFEARLTPQPEWVPARRYFVAATFAAFCGVLLLRHN